jgi:hypothetical protein
MKKMMQRSLAVLGMAVVVGGLMAGSASAQVVAQSGNTIITGAPGGPYRISQDGGRTWNPYTVRPIPKPEKLPAVPAKPGVACDFYERGTRLVVVPAGSAAPAGCRAVGSGVIDGRRVDPRTNVLR